MDSDLGPDSLEKLGLRIAANTSIVCNYLREQNEPQPTFAADGPAFFPQAAPANVARARNELIGSALMLHYLALWPAGAIDWYTNSGFLDVSSIGWLCHFKVPQTVPLEGSMSFGDLAVKCGLDERPLKSVLRHAMTGGWFQEPEPMSVAHTAMSKLIVTNESLYSQLAYRTQVVFPASTKLIEATERFGKDPTTSNAAFNIAHDTELPSMVWAARNAATAPLFSGLMRAYQASNAHNLTHLVKGYDWKSLGKGLLVDVRDLMSSIFCMELLPF
jgi:6-hydroxytryprostatin B O-methyltransferase